MSRRQREQHRQRSAYVHAQAAYEASPLRLSDRAVDQVLEDLCVRLGYCLAAADSLQLKADPPTTPLDFAQAVMRLEGIPTTDRDQLASVMAVTLAAFTRERTA